MLFRSLLGLLSDGGVHSHTTHFYALIRAAKNAGIENIYVHAFLDGRDVGPKTGAKFVGGLCDECKEVGAGKIATVMGRFYAMDRDKRWDRLQRAYNAIVRGEGIISPDPVAAVESSYEQGVTDEFVEPIICDSEGMIKPGDTAIFVNFRPDRAREITDRKSVV